MVVPAWRESVVSGQLYDCVQGRDGGDAAAFGTELVESRKQKSCLDIGSITARYWLDIGSKVKSRFVL